LKTAASTIQKKCRHVKMAIDPGTGYREMVIITGVKGRSSAGD
jgi:hypothetical protein